MASESGYNNAKKQGAVQHKTIHDLGSSRFGQHVVTKALADRSAIPVTITTVVQGKNKKDEPLLQLGITAHGALKGDVLRFLSGPLAGAELEVVSVTDANNLIVRDIMDVLPTAGNTVGPMFYVTSKADAAGNANFSPGPTQFIQNGSATQVILDPVTPANNRALPSQLMVIKDGVQLPVTKNTVTPSQTVAVPVEIVAASGTTININAGDIAIQLTDMGASADATKIGDGTGNYVGVTLAGEAKVKDADSLAKLTSLDAKSPALVAGKVPVDTGLAQGITNAEIRATALPTTVAGVSTELKQDAAAVLTGAVTEVAPVTDIASSGINGRLQRIAQRLTSLIALLPISLGQKTMAGSLAVTMASDQAALALPTGASTSANQTLQTTELASINLKTFDSFLDTSNSSSTTLLASATYTGAWFEAYKYSTLSVLLNPSHAGTLNLEFSSNGVTVHDVDVHAVPAGSGKTYTYGTKSRFMRVRYVNGATAQTAFTLQSIWHAQAIKNSSHTAGDTIDAGDDLELVKSVISGLSPSGLFVNVKVSNTGSLRTSIEEIEPSLVFKTLPATPVASYQEDLTVDTVVETFIAPVGSRWCKIHADSNNVANLRVKLGGVASTTSGHPMEPGRSEDFQVAGNVSYCAESGAGNKIYVTFGV